jgi:ferritin
MEIKKPSLKEQSVLATKDAKRLKQEMIDALNGQIIIEFNTVSLFQSMYACTEDKGYANASKFFQKKVKEEQGHVNRVYKYMLDKGIQPITPPISQPTTYYTSLPDIIEECRLYQVGVTQSYEKIGELAIALGDHTTYNFIQFFLDDQVDEEATFITLSAQWKILSQGGVTGLALIQLDEMFEQFI